MIIECPRCGAKNQTAQPPQLGKKYRCGKCGTEITFLQSTDTKGFSTEIPPEMTRPETVTLATENTSGQGKQAVVPQGIKGWNWGAFLLTLIWGAYHNVWWALLMFIPYVGIIVPIVFGVKGNEWAWQKKRWNSIEHFKRTQRKWAWWGLGVVVVVFVFYKLIYSL